MMRNRIPAAMLTLLIMALCLPACSMKEISRLNSREPHVVEKLRALNYGLKSESWEVASRFFSEDYEGGYPDLRSMLESRWRNEDLVELRFTLLDVNETGDNIKARVRWYKSFVNPAGILKEKDGASEIDFTYTGKQLRITAVHGDPFF